MRSLLKAGASIETKSNRHLEMLNVRSAEEAYAAVKELASSLTGDEHLIRSCIFDLHAAVENELRRIFYHTFKAHLFLTNDEEKNKQTLADFDK
jgi:DNA-directed RNA polymerase subunit F